MGCIIAMRSATLAEKSLRAIRGTGIACEKVSVDPSLTGKGCAFGISLPCRDVDAAKLLLDRRHITYGDVIGGY